MVGPCPSVEEWTMQRRSLARLFDLIFSLALVVVLVFGSVGHASAATVIYVKPTGSGASPCRLNFPSAHTARKAFSPSL